MVFSDDDNNNNDDDDDNNNNDDDDNNNKHDDDNNNHNDDNNNIINNNTGNFLYRVLLGDLSTSQINTSLIKCFTRVKTKRKSQRTIGKEECVQ